MDLQMNEEIKLICPKCNSYHINMLALNKFNSDWYACQNCFHRWSPPNADKVIENMIKLAQNHKPGEVTE